MRISLFAIFLFSTGDLWGQSLSTSALSGSEFHRESIQLHINSTVFLAGETLLFKVYCSNPDDSGRPSGLSSVAYVELIGEDLRPAVQMKVKLKEGVGHGDFLFDAKFASGNYTLIAYTKWMRNFSQNHIFRRTVMVLNPEIKPATSKPSLDTVIRTTVQNPDLIPGTFFSMNKKEYGRREKVQIEMVGKDSSWLNLSINVRKLEREIPSAFRCEEPVDKAPSMINGIVLLPDLRGELISGRVTEKNSGHAADGRLLTLSSPSKDFGFLVSTTDQNGNYFFTARHLDSDYYLLNIQGEDRQSFFIAAENSFLSDYSGFAPPKFQMDTAMREMVRTRHLSQQVENAFYAFKKDSVIGGDGAHRFFFTSDRVYHLDDFTRFTTMEDVFREIIPEVVVKKRDSDFSLVLRNLKTGFRFTNAPLVIVDGVPVADANIVMAYDPLLIKNIALMAQHYFYGNLETDGIISIETYTGEAKNIDVDGMTRYPYIQPLSSKLYYSPDYEHQKDLARIPDFRIQLYWNPHVIVPAGDSRNVTFFTGDLQGQFYVEIFGMTSSGECLYQKESFVVK
jgi:hypothetical protein